MCADRAQHVTEVIRPALAAGTVVVCDRYSDSTLAYQGFGRGVDLASLETLVRFATGGLQPHLTILINLDVRLGLERKRRASQAGEDDLNRIDLRDVPYHQRVRDGFLTLAAREPERFFVVDGTSPRRRSRTRSGAGSGAWWGCRRRLRACCDPAGHRLGSFVGRRRAERRGGRRLAGPLQQGEGRAILGDVDRAREVTAGLGEQRRHAVVVRDVVQEEAGHAGLPGLAGGLPGGAVAGQGRLAAAGRPAPPPRGSGRQPRPLPDARRRWDGNPRCRPGAPPRGRAAGRRSTAQPRLVPSSGMWSARNGVRWASGHSSTDRPACSVAPGHPPAAVLDELHGVRGHHVKQGAGGFEHRRGPVDVDGGRRATRPHRLQADVQQEGLQAQQVVGVAMAEEDPGHRAQRDVRPLQPGDDLEAPAGVQQQHPLRRHLDGDRGVAARGMGAPAGADEDDALPGLQGGWGGVLPDRGHWLE